MRRTQKPPTAAADEKLTALIERQAEADSATDRVAEAVENAKKEQNLASAIVDVINGADPEQVADDLIAAADPPKARTKRATKQTTTETVTEPTVTEAAKPATVEQRFYINGKLLSRKTLGAVAYHQGYVLVPAGQRMPLPDFEQWLKEQGVGDPYGEWDVTFGDTASKTARGKVLSARLASGGTFPAPTAPAESKPDATAKSAKLARVDELSAKLQADRAAKETAPATTRKSRAAAKQTVSEAS